MHKDRGALDGGRYSEDIFDAIVRHTRLVPREVIGIGGAIYDIVGERGFDTVLSECDHPVRWTADRVR